MSNPGNHHKINYIEFASNDLERTKRFYEKVFGWSFQDWGPDYVSFSGALAGIDGGFRKCSRQEELAHFDPLIVLYSENLKATQDAIEAAGGTIVVPAFEFPGGRRFHFADGSGNILAVWSK
ncbi:MAG TPA: VOC family protein [Terriglobia bacterium]|nr:VOC family protein [Terriglobia bacterium]